MLPFMQYDTGKLTLSSFVLGAIHFFQCYFCLLIMKITKNENSCMAYKPNCAYINGTRSTLSKLIQQGDLGSTVSVSSAGGGTPAVKGFWCTSYSQVAPGSDIYGYFYVMQKIKFCISSVLVRTELSLAGSVVTFRTLSFYYARQLYRQVLLRARISYGISVRPSVRPSVTTRWYTKHR